MEEISKIFNKEEIIDLDHIPEKSGRVLVCLLANNLNLFERLL